MTNSCSAKGTGLITLVQALQKINNLIIPITESERVILKNAKGRILADSIYSPINIPPTKNSAMDGYAFSSTDIIHKQRFSLILAGTSWAGKPYDKQLKSGECIRVFTGAVIPDGADSVIIQEHIEKNGINIDFPTTTLPKQNIRTAGSDIKKNTKILPAFKEISAIDIGLAASAGIYDLVVKRKLDIAFFSTGDELCTIGKVLKPGQIYDSNRYSLNALLDENKYNSCDLGVIADDKTLIKETLLTAAKTNDVIITSGGASVGDADYIKEIIEQFGSISFDKVAIKPGKPLIFGKINDCYFFGLPGNPVSVITTFLKIVSPSLLNLVGMTRKKTLRLLAICTSTLKKDPGRQEFQRGILTQNKSGELFVQSAGKQDSSIMSVTSKANCYIVLPSNSRGVLAGHKVIVELFFGVCV